VTPSEKPSTSSAYPEPVPGTSSSSSKTKTAAPAKKSPPVSAAGPSGNPTKKSSPFDDPKPGPSTTAADFDLEVFDSCSSCSLETDCWGCTNSSCESSPITGHGSHGLADIVTTLSHRPHHAKGNKKKLRHNSVQAAAIPGCSKEAAIPQQIPSDLNSDNSSLEDFSMASPIAVDMPEVVVSANGDADSDSGSHGDNNGEDGPHGSVAAAGPPGLPLGDPPLGDLDDVPASACPSETEEATSERGDLDLASNEDDDAAIEDVEEDREDLPEDADMLADAGDCQCQPGSADKCWLCSNKAPVPSTSAASCSRAAAAGATSHCKLFGLKLHCHSGDSASSACGGAAGGVVTASGGNDNVDQIVQDHDNFGTDENEDSLDSSALLLSQPPSNTQPQPEKSTLPLTIFPGGVAPESVAASSAESGPVVGTESRNLDPAPTSSSSSVGAKRKGLRDSFSPDGTYSTSKKKRKDASSLTEPNESSTSSLKVANLSLAPAGEAGPSCSLAGTPAAAAAVPETPTSAVISRKDRLMEVGEEEGSSRDRQEQEICSTDRVVADAHQASASASVVTASASASGSDCSRTDEENDEDEELYSPTTTPRRCECGQIQGSDSVEEEVVVTVDGDKDQVVNFFEYTTGSGDDQRATINVSTCRFCGGRRMEEGATDLSSSPEPPSLITTSPTTAAGPPSPAAPSAAKENMNLIPDKDNPPQEMLDWVESFSRWSHAQRLLAIDQLIGRCEPTQVRHMMAVIEPQFQRDFISLLPKELALYVLSFLKPRDLLNAAQTCRYWRILAEDNLLWREKCREAGMSESVATKNRKKASANFVYSTWKLGFMREHKIESNWRTRSCMDNQKILKGHDDHVITCLQFSNNRIVSGSDDNTLKVWNASTGRCLRTLVGHTGGVWSSQMEGNVIVSGSTDRTLKVWNAESGACDHTLYGHTSTVRCMHLHKNLVVSGSRDATLRMWDITSGECLHVLMGHVAAVRCVQYDGRLVVSGAYDYMVKVWNPVTEECLHTLSGHTNRVYSLQFDGVHVVSGSLDTSIRVWDVETGACKHALMGHQSLTSGMELKDNILVSGNADSTVKVWDITTGQCLQTLSGPNKHQSAVTCLQFNKKFVITSSDDGTVKLWDVKTGEFIRDLVSLKSGGSGGVVWRIRANATKLVCAVGSRNGTEETKLMVLDFDVAETR